MAVIFFDGFREIDAYNWTATGATSDGSVANISPTAAANNTVTNNLTLANFGTHAGKKLYFGFKPQSYHVPKITSGAGQPFIKFYNSSDVEVLALHFNTASTTTPDIGLQVRQGGSAVTTYKLLNSIAPVIYTDGTNPDLVGGYFGVFDAYRMLEFEIDLNSTPNTLAIQYIGQSLFNSSLAAVTELSNAIDDIAKIVIYGGIIADSSFDDLYLADDTGSFANTWLGANVQVHSPGFGDAQVNEWQGSPDTGGGSVASNDGDNSYIRTGLFDKYQTYDVNNISPSGFSPAVGAIKLTSVVRRVLFNSAYRYVYYNVGTTTHYEVSASIPVTTNNYVRKPPVFVSQNPETTAQWTVEEINTNGFGVKSVDPNA